MSTRLNIDINDESGQPIMGDHKHPDGLFCDDCPDALRRNIKRILIQHQWTTDYYDRDCDCGWSMPFKEEQQFAAHLADVLSAALTDLGWVRAAPLQADRDALAAKVADLTRRHAAEEKRADTNLDAALAMQSKHDALAVKVADVVNRFGDHTEFRKQMVTMSEEKQRGGDIRGTFASNADYMITLVDALDDLRAALTDSDTA